MAISHANKVDQNALEQTSQSQRLHLQKQGFSLGQFPHSSTRKRPLRFVVQRSIQLGFAFS